MLSISPPTPSELGVIARMYDPRVALAATRVTQIQSLSAELRFTAGTPGEIAPLASFVPQSAPILGFDLSYAVSQPEYLLGSIQRAQQINGNAQAPDVDITVSVSQGWGPSNWLVNIEGQPIEQIARWAGKNELGGCNWTSGAMIMPWQTISIRGVLRRAYAAEGETPLILRPGLRFAYLGPFLNMDVEDACAQLAGLGVKGLPSDAGSLGELRKFVARRDEEWERLGFAAGQRRLPMSLFASMRRLLGGTPRPGEPSIATVSTTGWEPALGGIGSSPAKGDLGASYLTIPPAPGEYLFRLCAFDVPVGFACRVVSFAQYLEIGLSVPVGESDPAPYPLGLQVTAPMWRPPGSAMAWGLTTRPSIEPRPTSTRYGGQGTDTSLDGLAPARLIRPPPAATNVPLTRGLWPGTPLGGSDMGVMRDIRSPWGKVERALDYAVQGGTTLTFWGWVKQRDPSKYDALTLPMGAEAGALSPEDRFMLSFPAALLTRIGGRITLELSPDTNDSRREAL